MSLARGTGLRLASYGAGGVLSLVSLPLLVRHLGVADFGRYVAVLSVVGIAALASDLGITGIALREYSSSSDEERPALLRSLLAVRIAIACAGIAAALAFVLAAGYPQRALVGTAIACVGLFPQVYADFVVVSLLASSRFGRAAAVDLSRSTVSTALIVAFVLAGASLAWFLAAYALAALAGALVARRFQTGELSLRPGLPTGRARELLAGSVVYALATAVHVVYFRAVMLVVSVQSTTRQAGYYATAFRLAEFAAAAAGIMAATATPGLVRAADAGRLSSQAKGLCAAAGGVGVVIAAATALMAPLIVRVIGGAGLAPAAPVLRIEAIAMGLAFPVFTAGAVLLVMRRHALLLAANVIGLAVALLSALVLVPDHGARGGAEAAALAEATLLIVLSAALVQAMRRRQLDLGVSPAP